MAQMTTATSLKTPLYTALCVTGLIVFNTSLAQSNASSLPRIVGTELPGTAKKLVGITIDGNRLAAAGNSYGGYIPDVDGDGIVEAYIKVVEPDLPCESLVYLPSTVSTESDLLSTDLSSYTRIRNFGVLLDEDGTVVCPDSSQRLTRFGDLNGDGISEIATQYAYNGELIFSGDLPNGTLIEATNPLAEKVTVIGDDLEVNPMGDFNGDGLVDWSLYSYSDRADRRDECLIVASQQGALPSVLDFDSVGEEAPLASLSRINDRCPRISPVGDVNGDGIDDVTIDDGQYWIVHGKAERTLDDNYRGEGYEVFRNAPFEFRSIDFDADGFDDLLMDTTNMAVDSLLAGTGTVIAYGGPDGVLRVDEFQQLPDNRITQIVQKYARVQSGLVSNAQQPVTLGDINGDSASDLLVTNNNQSSRLVGSILYGMPGQRPAVILEASVDGGNGINWSEDNSFYGTPSPGDFNGDGFDEIAYIDTLMFGTGPIRRAGDPGSTFIFDGPDSLDVSWQPPSDSDLASAYRLVADSVTIAELPESIRQYRISGTASNSVRELRIQTLDANGDVVGEVIRHPSLDSTEFESVSKEFGDVETTATSAGVPAATYTLTGVSYGPALGELFWNVTKRFVLVWRNGELIDRVEGNSYLVREGGEFFITVDYASELAAGSGADLLANGTLRRSNIVSVNNTDSNTSTPPADSGDIAGPENLLAELYSDTTAELFWDRAAPTANINTYNIDRDGIRIGSTSGISYLDNTRVAGQRYTYSVTAITNDGNLSMASTIETDAYGHQGSDAPPPSMTVLPLTGVVYSRSAIELFWDTDVLDTIQAVTYEVLQNGTSVRRSDGRSYFTNELEADTRYVYTVIARNASQQEVARSDALAVNTR